jgi:RND family efflux transporter MFP subunit
MKRLLKALLIVAIVGAGFFVYRILASARTNPEKKPPKESVAIVSVVEARSVTERISIASMGTVLPSRTVTLFPEVGGRVVYQSPNLVPGGRFRKGERILKIDPRDYDLSEQQQDANVRRAEMDLATERARKVVAEQEWELIKGEVQPTEDGKRLALRDIQLETAEAALASAKSGLDKARLARSRTVIKAPINGMVTEEFVDSGQIIAPGSRVATLVDSDTFWVRVAVPVDQLPWVSVPGAGGATEGSRVRIVHRISDTTQVVREGKVIRLLGDLDSRGKMARLLAEIPDPLGESIDKDGARGGLPLLMGAYVNVEIEGPEIENVIEIPRRAVRDRSQVWIKRDGRLAIGEVDIVWSSRERVFLRGGVRAGDEVIISHIAAPIQGMAVALENDAVAPAADTPKPSAPEAAR